MIIISDTSVISSLIQIGHLDILRELFQEILIPKAVEDELLKLESFEINLSQFKEADWVKIKNPTNRSIEANLLSTLDKGESAAIALALETNIDYLAIDERAGRQVAKSLGIPIIGLIGILIRSKDLGVIDEVKPILNKLISEANFYISESFYHSILTQLGE